MFIFKIGSDEVRVRTDEEFKSLNDDEKTELNKTLEAVKKTVAETEL